MTFLSWITIAILRKFQPAARLLPLSWRDFTSDRRLRSVRKGQGKRLASPRSLFFQFGKRLATPHLVNRSLAPPVDFSFRRGVLRFHSTERLADSGHLHTDARTEP